MWKAQAGVQIKSSKDNQGGDDDWETDPDFINDVSEQEQRWGSATIEGSGRTAGAIDMQKLRKETEEADAQKKKKDMSEGPQASFGYGGKFGVEKDRMDSSAVGHDYTPGLQKHASQKDYSTGFGGKYGVQKDRVDKCAAGWDHKEKVEKHASQKDYATGFGGKFGVQADRQDKSAVGWDHVERVDKHESQKDYAKGFGGKFGVQSDRQDKSAVGWDHHEAPQKHESQTDHKIGFGGKFGVQTDRMDKSASAFGDEPEKIGTNYTKTKPDIGGAKPSDLRAKFEHMSSTESDSKPSSVTSSPAPKKNVHSRAAMFSNNAQQQEEQNPQSMVERAPKKQIDQSRIAFLTQSSQNENSTTTTVERSAAPPGQLDQSKLSQFSSKSSSGVAAVGNSENKIKEELEQLKQMQQQKMQEEVIEHQEPEEQIYENFQNVVGQVAPSVDQVMQEQPQVSEPIHQEIPVVATPVVAAPVVATPVVATDEEVAQTQEEEIVDTGLSAIALYDYEAGADDEISFDPEDVITHIEMIDEGWWRGMCKGKYGLFPANYVQLHQ